MSEADDLRDALTGARIVLKGAQRTIRSTLGVLADLEERLAALEIAQPGGTANEFDGTDLGRRIAEASAGAGNRTAA